MSAPAVAEEEVALSTLIDKLNERFGTDFTEADQLFFDQVRATAEEDGRSWRPPKPTTSTTSARVGPDARRVVYRAHGGQRGNLRSCHE